MSLLQAGQCSRTSEGDRGEQGATLSLREHYLGGHNARHVGSDTLPIGTAWAAAQNLAQERGLGDISWVNEERMVCSSGSQGRHPGEGGTWSGMVGFQMQNQSDTKCHAFLIRSKRRHAGNPRFVFQWGERGNLLWKVGKQRLRKFVFYQSPSFCYFQSGATFNLDIQDRPWPTI